MPAGDPQVSAAGCRLAIHYDYCLLLPNILNKKPAFTHENIVKDNAKVLNSSSLEFSLAIFTDKRSQ